MSDFYNHYEEKGFLLSVTAIPPGKCSENTVYYLMSCAFGVTKTKKDISIDEYPALMDSNGMGPRAIKD